RIFLLQGISTSYDLRSHRHLRALFVHPQQMQQLFVDVNTQNCNRVLTSELSPEPLQRPW
ncbi:MAG: hypothetical protein AAGJ35_10690, partial [Myxococcota bacterium]